MKKQFAVFDIDSTIARVNLLQLMVGELVALGKLDVGPGKQVETMLHDYRRRIDENNFNEYIKQVVDTLFKSLPGGLRVEEYDQVIDAIVKTALSDTYVYTRELLQTLKRNNFFLIAISGAEVKAVGTLAKSLGFDAWVGEVSFIEKNGKLSGEMQTLSQTKDQILRSLIEKFDLEIKGSTAVGDSGRDMGVLEMVDSPIVFNPNQALFKIARAKGWMVIIESKDMVYGLVKDGEQYVLKQVNA